MMREPSSASLSPCFVFIYLYFLSSRSGSFGGAGVETAVIEVKKLIGNIKERGMLLFRQFKNDLLSASFALIGIFSTSLIWICVLLAAYFVLKFSWELELP